MSTADKFNEMFSFVKVCPLVGKFTAMDGATLSTKNVYIVVFELPAVSLTVTVKVLLADCVLHEDLLNGNTTVLLLNITVSDVLQLDT